MLIKATGNKLKVGVQTLTELDSTTNIELQEQICARIDPAKNENLALRKYTMFFCERRGPRTFPCRWNNRDLEPMCVHT